jgi:hypothetical protein
MGARAAGLNLLVALVGLGGRGHVPILRFLDAGFQTLANAMQSDDPTALGGSLAFPQFCRSMALSGAGRCRKRKKAGARIGRPALLAAY